MTGPIDLFVTAGQSNAQGRGDSTLSPATVENVAYERRHDGSIITPVTDPVGVGHNPATTGSFVPAFLNSVTAATGVPACIAHGAPLGGTALLSATSSPNGRWDTAGTRLADWAAIATDALADLTSAGWTPTLRGAVWHQGERDIQHHPGTTAELKAAYKAGLATLLADMRSLSGVAAMDLYVMQVGVVDGYAERSAAVQDAQAEACAETPGLVLVYDRCKDFPALGWMKSDLLHYTQAGYNDMGSAAGSVVAANLAGEEPVIPPPAVGGQHRKNAAGLFLAASV